MPIAFPDEWLGYPPEMLVVGNGPFATALSQVLAAAQIGSDDMIFLPEADNNGKYPRVLNDLQRVFFVVDPAKSAADALMVHDVVWEWVQRLTALKARHQLAIQFIIPRNAEREFREAMCIGLSLTDLDMEIEGYGVCSMEDGLFSLVRLASRIFPKDFIILKNRRNADGRRLALTSFRTAVMQGDDVIIREAAIEVETTFRKKRHYLDLFCNPPRHSNGNSLRSLLEGVVTGSVTPLHEELSRELEKLLR